MGSRSDACRCDAEGYPHPMASTGAASLGSLSQRNGGIRALGDGKGQGHPTAMSKHIYNIGAAGVGHVRARFGGGLVVLWS